MGIHGLSIHGLSIENHTKKLLEDVLQHLCVPLPRSFVTFLVLVRSSSAKHVCLCVKDNNNLLQMILHLVKFPKILVNLTGILNKITTYVATSLLKDYKSSIFVVCDPQSLYTVWPRCT